MNSRERFHAIFTEEGPDRSPFCLWLPLALQFMSQDSLKAASLAWMQAFDSDLVRVPGVESYPFPLHLELSNPKLLAKIQPKTANETRWLNRRGTFQEIQKLSNQEYALAETVLGPLSCLERICPKELILEAAKTCPGILKSALSAITESLTGYLNALGSSGADAYFLELRSFSYDDWTEDFYLEYGVPFDKELLTATSGIRSIVQTAPNRIFTDVVVHYPADILLLPPQQSETSIIKFAKEFPGKLAGGLSNTILLNHPVKAVEHHIFSVMDSPRFSLIAPDTNLPYDLDFERLQFVAKSLHKKPPKLKLRK